MSENKLNRQLAAGIRAAQQGDRERARELLEGVLRKDRNNEQAWIWLASVVESQKERRLTLERVLKINPNNRPAQAALNSMVGVLGSGSDNTKIDYGAMSAAAKTRAPASVQNIPEPKRPSNRAKLLPYLFGGAIILGLLLAGSIFLQPIIFPDPTETPTPTVLTPTPTGPTVDPRIPTATVTPSPTSTFDVFAVDDIITNTPLGATFTPTITPTLTNTPTPTATLPSIALYNYIVRGSTEIRGSTDTVNAGLFNLSGDGTMLEILLPNATDFDFDPETGALVFTQNQFITLPTPTPVATNTPDFVNTATPVPVETETSGGGFVVSRDTSQPTQIRVSQMFLTNINDLDTRVEITSSILQSAIAPAISPDGNLVAFASDADGDYEIYLYNVATGLSEQITDNILTEDIDPSWSPDGELLLFSSDRVSAGNHDLFTIDPFVTNPEPTVEQITETSGQALTAQYSPDGSQIVFLLIDDRGAGIRLTNRNGSSLRSITRDFLATYGEPAWTRDGSYIVYSASPPEEDRLEFRIYAPTTGENREVFVDGFSTLQIVQR